MSTRVLASASQAKEPKMRRQSIDDASEGSNAPLWCRIDGGNVRDGEHLHTQHRTHTTKNCLFCFAQVSCASCVGNCVPTLTSVLRFVISRDIQPGGISLMFLGWRPVLNPCYMYGAESCVSRGDDDQLQREEGHQLHIGST